MRDHLLHCFIMPCNNVIINDNDGDSDNENNCNADSINNKIN